MNITQVQTALTAAGFSCAADGVVGPKTYGAMLGFAAMRQLGDLGDQLGQGMAVHLPAYQITAGLGLAHWIAETCHETEGYRYLVELGGPSYWARYENDKELGNTQPGDGYAFRGRGLIQITGRWNYGHFGQVLGLDLLGAPDQAAEPAIAVLLACQFWKERGIEALAEADDIQGVTHKINGGLNGLADRQAITWRMKHLFGIA